MYKNSESHFKILIFSFILFLAVISLACEETNASEVENALDNDFYTNSSSDFEVNSTNYNTVNFNNSTTSTISNISNISNSSNTSNTSSSDYNSFNSANVDYNENNDSGKLSVPNVYGSYDEGVVLSATLTDQNNNPLSNRKIIFYVDDVKVGEANTNEQGIANFNYKPPAYDNFVIRASYSGTDYPTEDVEAGMAIQGAKSYLKVYPASGMFGKNITLTALFTDKNNVGISKKVIYFEINGIRIGQATTNSQGLAKLIYRLDQVGNLLVTSKYGGNDYKADDATGKLSVSKLKTQISINKFKGYYNQKSAIIVTLNKGITSLVGKKVKFYVNNKLVGNGTINYQTMAGLIYKVKSIGKFTIKAVFNGDENHTSVTKSKTFSIPSSTLFVINNRLVKNKRVYIQTTLINVGPKKSSFKISYKIPKKFKYFKPKVSTGKVIYNAKKRTLTWTLKKLKVHKSKSARLYWILTSKKGKFNLKPKVIKASRTRLEYNNKLSFVVR